MLIPKGATIIMPTYALNFTYHDDPNTYNPDRYLQHPKLAVEYAAASDYNNRDHYTFGSGRRICVGIHLAERTLWRMIAQILWAFEIKQPIDEHGNQVDLDETAYTDGMVLSLKPFMVRLTPRSAKHAEIVMKAAEESKDFLRQWE
jgi:cytochrome P450